MSSYSSSLSANSDFGCSSFTSDADCPFPDTSLLDTEPLENVLLHDIRLQGSWAEYDILGSGVQQDLPPEAPIAAQSTYFIAPVPFWPLRPPYTDGGFHHQARVDCPDELYQATLQSNACTAPPWTSINLTCSLPQTPDEHAIKYFHSFIAGCQARLPELAAVMEEMKSRQNVTKQNEFTVYAAFVFRKDYTMVAKVFSALFYHLSEDALRMRFQRMTIKKGNGELLRLAKEM